MSDVKAKDIITIGDSGNASPVIKALDIIMNQEPIHVVNRQPTCCEKTRSATLKEVGAKIEGWIINESFCGGCVLQVSRKTIESLKRGEL